MNLIEIKTTLMKQGLTTADVVRKLCEEYPDVQENSMRTMIDDIFKGHRYYPRYVNSLRQFGITINRPEWLKPVRDRMKTAA